MDTLDKYAGSTGETRRRADEQRRDAANLVDAEAERRDLTSRLPYGRALDHEHLVWMLDESNGRNWAIVMRRKLLAHVLHNLPPGVLITRDELEQVRAYVKEHPGRPGACPGIPEGLPAS